MAFLRIKRVPAAELRKLFNQAGYWARAAAGELFEKVLYEGHPSPARSGEPPCTRSQIIAYLDSRGHKVALVRQYLRKDNTIGGSGKPDPKKLFHAGVLYVLE